FGRVMKEGPAEDFANREAIAKLFRFSTTHTNQEAEDQSLDDYVSRMREPQKEIYYICGDSFAAVSKSPHLEVFREEGIEVILLHDRIDEWTMTTLQEFAGRSLKDLARGELDLGELRSETSKDEESSPDRSAFLERLKAAVGERVEDIRFSSRLTDSPACLVVGEFSLGFQMQRVMQAAGQDVPASKPIFELNPQHALVKRLESEENEGRFEDLALVLFDQAKLAAGIQLDDPGTYVERMNRLLGELASG
ncbi:MAG: molecular chaperone HtpG, partial [Gammaproteobacteria bacterium]